ncbi:MAG: hypothetical protein MHM6MM_005949 [Cercozoa sp. M6MM]
MSDSLSDYSWLLVASVVVAFGMAFGIGANDVANAFATSVASRALTLRQAVLIGAIFEFAGAALMGTHVANTIADGVVKGELFEDAPELLMLGFFCALFAAMAWLAIATKWALPVSTTHSIIGGVVGFAVCAHGFRAVKWTKLLLIFSTWLTSPILSGVCAILVFGGTRKYILRHPASLRRALLALPLVSMVTLTTCSFFVVYKGAPFLYDLVEHLSAGVVFLICAGISTVASVLIGVFVVPILRRRAQELSDRGVAAIALEATEDTEFQNDDSLSASDEKALLSDATRVSNYGAVAPEQANDFVEDDIDIDIEDSTVDLHARAARDSHVQAMRDTAEKFDEATEKTFNLMQVATSCFLAFAHGANDTANAIGPLAAIVAIYKTGEAHPDTSMPVWVLLLGATGLVLGLALCGWRVIEAVGCRLAVVTSSRGFSIQFTTAFVVAFASRLGIPVSTTHCQVGATVGVACTEEQRKSAVNWSLLSRVFASWVATLLIAAATSALLFSFAAFSPSAR